MILGKFYPKQNIKLNYQVISLSDSKKITNEQMNFMLIHCIAQSHWTYFSGVPKIFTWLHQIAIKLFRVLPPTKELLGILILRSKSINLHSADWLFWLDLLGFHPKSE